VNRWLAAVNLGFTLTQARASTQFERAAQQAGNIGGALGSIITLTGLPPHMGNYINMYLVPMTQAIMVMVSRIVGLLQTENDLWVELTGAPGRYGAEEGGEPMWKFMNGTMKARYPEGIPQIDKAIANYLVEHRDRLEAGTGQAVPTTWLSQLDTDRARRWIFDHRDKIWAMFYGSRRLSH